MIVEVNTDTLIKADLTANQYLISYLIYQRAYSAYDNLKFNSPQIVKDELKELINKGFIFQTDTRMGYSVTDKFLEYFGNKDQFNELLDHYPTYVIRPDGQKDFLRTDRAKNKKRYDNIVKRNKSKHQHIIKCLDFEIQFRKNTDSLKYMKKLSNWIESCEWEIWSERMELEPSLKKSNTYGTELE